MVFTRKVNSIAPRPLLLGGFLLSSVKRVVYLGFTLTPNLHWHSHCNRIISSASRASHKVSRVISQYGPSPKVIRQHRPAFNQSLFTRQLSPTAKCPFCGFIEDVEHVLLECYAYDSARHSLSNALWSLVADTKHANAGWSLFRSLHGVRALSGEVAHVPPRFRSDVLHISAAFLFAINDIRPI